MQEKHKSLLDSLAYSGLLGGNDNAGLKLSFNPYDFDIMRLNWNSPNDGLENIFRITFDPKELKTLKIKDNH